jgi:hypothetical protein
MDMNRELAPTHFDIRQPEDAKIRVIE